MSLREARRLSNVHTLWACWRHQSVRRETPDSDTNVDIYGQVLFQVKSEEGMKEEMV